MLFNSRSLLEKLTVSDLQIRDTSGTNYRFMFHRKFNYSLGIKVTANTHYKALFYYRFQTNSQFYGTLNVRLQDEEGTWLRMPLASPSPRLYGNKFKCLSMLISQQARQQTCSKLLLMDIRRLGRISVLQCDFHRMLTPSHNIACKGGVSSHISRYSHQLSKKE